MWIQIEHSLLFTYSDFISESSIELRIEPRSTSNQTLRSFALAVGPPTHIHRYVDWSGNVVHHFGIGDYHNRIEVLATSVIETHPGRPSLDQIVERPTARAALGPLLEWTHFDGPVVDSPALREFAAELRTTADDPLGEQLTETGALIQRELPYVQGVTNYKSTTDDVIAGEAGVCQDFAHLQIALFRLRGIPARYASGYLHLGTGEAAESHAWIQVHADGRGWVSYDPTHVQIPDERYVAVGWGRSYEDVAPNRGVFRGSASEELEAIVRTLESQPHDIVDLHEPVAQIDVPVFREIPPAESERPEGTQAEQQQPGQQQQQQQQK